MPLLPIAVALLIGALALAFVLYPLYHRVPAKMQSVASQRVETSTQTDREQAARIVLQEVELDYQLGNIAENDYRSLRERYMRRAIVALKSRYDRDEELDERIEEQLRKLRGEDEHVAE